MRASCKTYLGKILVPLERLTDQVAELDGEVFKWNLGMQPMDEEWTEEQETLQNWRMWGAPGSGYEHLPVITQDMLYRETGDQEADELEIPHSELADLRGELTSVMDGEKVELTPSVVYRSGSEKGRGRGEEDVEMGDVGGLEEEDSGVDDSGDE